MSLVRHPHTPTSKRLLRKGSVIVLAAGLMVGAVSGLASAKETGSGGTTVPAGACNPVTSLSYKGDATTAETGQASIAVSYGVKPCANGQTVRVEAHLYRTIDPSVDVYFDANAALAGKFTVFGITPGTSYMVRIAVYDTADGALVGSQSIFAAANYKRV